MHNAWIAWIARVRWRRLIAPLLAAAVAVPLFPEIFGLDGTTPFTQLVAFRPQGIAVLLLVGVLVTVRWRPTGAVLLGLTVTAAALTAPRVLSDAGSAPAGATELTIVAANVLGGGGDAEEVAEVIRSHRPAFVSLPEAQDDVRRLIEAELDGLGYRGFTHQSDRSPVTATSVLVSGDLGAVRFGTDLGTGFATVVVTGGRLGGLRLVAYHAQPPLPGATRGWKRDHLALKRWCSTQAPVVVAGDFNAGLDHVAFRSALEGCVSAAAAVGKGLSGTWPAHRPALLRTQIDHVVVSEDITPTRFTTHHVRGSDHRAVVARVAMP